MAGAIRGLRARQGFRRRPTDDRGGCRLLWHACERRRGTREPDRPAVAAHLADHRGVRLRSRHAALAAIRRPRLGGADVELDRFPPGRNTFPPPRTRHVHLRSPGWPVARNTHAFLTVSTISIRLMSGVMTERGALSLRYGRMRMPIPGGW